MNIGIHPESGCDTVKARCLDRTDIVEGDRDLDGLVVTRKTPEILAPLGRLLAEKSKNAVIGARKTARPS